jgi:hypothetical protein
MGIQRNMPSTGGLLSSFSIAHSSGTPARCGTNVMGVHAMLSRQLLAAAAIPVLHC